MCQQTTHQFTYCLHTYQWVDPCTLRDVDHRGCKRTKIEQREMNYCATCREFQIRAGLR